MAEFNRAHRAVLALIAKKSPSTRSNDSDSADTWQPDLSIIDHDVLASVVKGSNLSRHLNPEHTFEPLFEELAGSTDVDLEDPTVDMLIRLADPHQLGHIHDPGLLRECLFRAGHYPEARNVHGWEHYSQERFSQQHLFVNETGLRDFRNVDMTWEEVYHLCEKFTQAGIVGNSLPMISLYQQVAQIASLCRGGLSPIVLIEGSPGTGKSAIAQGLHALTGRDTYHDINCGALAADIVLSELYGHVKGAFTGAVANRDGWFTNCKGGTLVLNDLNRMPLHQLSTLLHALQERRITPLGSNRSIDVNDTMVIATSNERLSTKEDFPGDLLERVSRHNLQVPSLTERVSDVPLLARFFLQPYDPVAKTLHPYRFQIAKQFRIWAQEGQLSIRDMQNSIAQVVQEAQPVTIVSTENQPLEAELSSIETAIEQIKARGESVTKAAIAGELHFERSNFSQPDNRWTKALRQIQPELFSNTV